MKWFVEVYEMIFWKVKCENACHQWKEKIIWSLKNCSHILEVYEMICWNIWNDLLKSEMWKSLSPMERENNLEFKEL
jgi:hypothetical protein